MTADLATFLAARPDRLPCGHHRAHRCACRTEDGEWALFVAAIRQAADADGTVSQTRVRPLIRGRIQPKHIGSCYRRATASGLLVEVGREDSTDVAGRNADKLQRVYRLGAVA